MVIIPVVSRGCGGTERFSNSAQITQVVGSRRDRALSPSSSDPAYPVTHQPEAASLKGGTGMPGPDFQGYCRERFTSSSGLLGVCVP